MPETRPLVPADRPAWEPLWRGYLAFYETSVPDGVTDLTWARFHDPAEPMLAFGAELEEKLAGIVHMVVHRSTWTAGPYVYLQDLFTAPEARGRGLARALIERVYGEARAIGAGRVHWLTHASNAPARALYDKVADNAGFIQYRKVL